MSTPRHFCKENDEFRSWTGLVTLQQDYPRAASVRTPLQQAVYLYGVLVGAF